MKRKLKKRNPVAKQLLTEKTFSGKVVPNKKRKILEEELLKEVEKVSGAFDFYD